METDRLVGYWKNVSADKNYNDLYDSTYLHFNSQNRLQWGYKNPDKICVVSFDYKIENDSIKTVLLPNPRQESTPFQITAEEKLKLIFSNSETSWTRTGKQDFFEREDKWEPEPEDIRPDYMKILSEPFTNFHKSIAKFYNSTSQLAANTQALWLVWDYSGEPFSSFHLEDFAYILSKGVIQNYRSNEKHTLLMLIAGDGHTEAVKLLLENGFDVNAQNFYGNTALDYAIFSKQIDTIKLLKESGAKTGTDL
jgi:hypothetical protein